MLLAALEPAAAALIGAGAACVVALAAQLLAHALSIKRDRLNQERARLDDAVVRAATALLTLSGDAPVRDDLEEPHPASIAATFRELRDPHLRALQERTMDTLNVLRAWS